MHMSSCMLDLFFFFLYYDWDEHGNGKKLEVWKQTPGSEWSIGIYHCVVDDLGTYWLSLNILLLHRYTNCYVHINSASIF